MNREEIVRVFSAMPTLKTERLILRPMRASDAADMYDYAKASASATATSTAMIAKAKI